MPKLFSVAQSTVTPGPLVSPKTPSLFRSHENVRAGVALGGWDTVRVTESPALMV
jgi:hypothetical protein